MGRPLKIAKTHTILTLTATTATTNVVTVNSTADLLTGMRFVVATTVGGLTAGTTYFVNEILTSTTFTALVSSPSVQPQVSPTLTTTTGQSVLVSVNIVDSGFGNPSGYGVVGGDTSIYGNQILIRCAIGLAGEGTISCADDSPNLLGANTTFDTQLSAGSVVTTADGIVLGYIDNVANATFATFAANAAANVSDSDWVYADNEAGYIVRQKGKTKYLVKGADTLLTAACYTSSAANAALTPNTFSIISTDAGAADTLVLSISDHTAELFGGDDTLANSTPAYVTFGSAAAANAAAGMPFPLVTINKA